MVFKPLSKLPTNVLMCMRGWGMWGEPFMVLTWDEPPRAELCLIVLGPCTGLAERAAGQIWGVCSGSQGSGPSLPSRPPRGQ